MEIGRAVDASSSDGEFDLFRCRIRPEGPDNWVLVDSVPGALVATVGPTHPLTDKPHVSRADLASAVWMLNFPASEARRGFDAVREQDGWGEPDHVHVASRVPVLSRSMLKNGTRVSFTRRGVVATWIDAGTPRVLAADTDYPLSPIGYHWLPASAGPAARLLIEHLAALAPDQQTRNPRT